MLHSKALWSVFLEARKTWVCKGLSVGDKPVPVDGSAVEATKGKAASVDACAGKADAGATTKAEACARNLEGAPRRLLKQRRFYYRDLASTTPCQSWAPAIANARQKRSLKSQCREGLISTIEGA